MWVLYDCNYSALSADSLWGCQDRHRVAASAIIQSWSPPRTEIITSESQFSSWFELSFPHSRLESVIVPTQQSLHIQAFLQVGNCLIVDSFDYYFMIISFLAQVPTSHLSLCNCLKPLAVTAVALFPGTVTLLVTPPHLVTAVGSLTFPHLLHLFSVMSAQIENVRSMWL